MAKTTTTASLDRIESTLAEIIRLLHELMSERRRNTFVKGAYSPAEAAVILGKRPYTVREWCRLGRVHATKRHVGRGAADEWEIRHEEIERIFNHGLLPLPKRY